MLSRRRKQLQRWHHVLTSDGSVRLFTECEDASVFLFFFNLRVWCAARFPLTFSPPSCQFNTFHIVCWAPFSPQSTVMRSLLPRLPLDRFGTSTVRRLSSRGQQSHDNAHRENCCKTPGVTLQSDLHVFANRNAVKIRVPVPQYEQKKQFDSSNCVPAVLPTVQQRNDALHRKDDSHQIALMETWH